MCFDGEIAPLGAFLKSWGVFYVLGSCIVGSFVFFFFF